MYVTKLEVSGVRSFHGARSVDLDFTRPDGSYAGWTVLAGRNGSGRTTLLQALAITLSGPQGALSLSRFTGWVGSGGTEAVTAAKVKRVRADGTGQQLFDLPWNLRMRWDLPPSADIDQEPEIFGECKPRDQRRIGPWGRDPSWFYAGYGPFRRLGEISVRRSRSLTIRNRAASLFDDQVPLSEAVGWLVEQHLYRLEEKPGAEELLSTVLDILGDGLLPDGFEIRRVDSDGLWASKNSREFPLRQMSDGYRTVTALVVDIMRQMHASYGRLEIDHSSGHPTLNHPGIVLIDEIDAHLHVSWQKKIGGWLKTHFPQIQFIVTTHSPYICQSADPGGLIRLPGPDEQTPPQVVEDDLYRRIVYGSGDDAVLTDLFGLENTYSDEAERLRDRAAELEESVLDGRASEAETEEYHRLSNQLQSSLRTQVHEVSHRLGFE